MGELIAIEANSQRTSTQLASRGAVAPLAGQAASGVPVEGTALQSPVIDEFDQAIQNTKKQVAERPVEKNMAVVCKSCLKSSEVASQKFQAQIDTLTEKLTQSVKQEQAQQKPKQESPNPAQQQKNFARFQENPPKLFTPAPQLKEEVAQPGKNQETKNSKSAEQNKQAKLPTAEITKQLLSQQANQTKQTTAQPTQTKGSPDVIEKNPETKQSVKVENGKSPELTLELAQKISYQNMALGRLAESPTTQLTNMVGKVAVVLSSIGSTIHTFNISARINNLINNFSTSLSRVQIATAQVMNAAGHVVSHVVEKASQIFSKAVTGIQNSLTTVAARIGSLATSLAQLVNNTSQFLLTKLSQIAGPVLQVMGKIQNIVSSILVKTQQILSDVAAKVGAALMVVVKNFQGFLKQAQASIVESLQKMLRLFFRQEMDDEKSVAEQISIYWGKFLKKLNVRKMRWKKRKNNLIADENSKESPFNWIAPESSTNEMYNPQVSHHASRG